MTDLLTTTEFKVADRTYSPGDRFDPAVPPASNNLAERDVERLKASRYIVPLTRPAFEVSHARRGPHLPKLGRGWTEAYLAELGIIDPLAAESKVADPAEPKPRTPAGEPIPLDRFFLHPFKIGKSPGKRYDLKDADGNLLRPAPFNSIDKAQAFVDDLLAKAAQGKPDPAAPETQQHDGELQSSADEPG